MKKGKIADSQENFVLIKLAEKMAEMDTAGFEDGKIMMEVAGPESMWYGNVALSRQMPFIIKFAKLKDPVLITGPTGTGKELIAKQIHALSSRNEGKFIPVNCGGLNEETLLSELFGHVKGAFTGAVGNKKGAVELAEDGTLFLDEISDMPQFAQVKMLRFLNDGAYQKMGALGTDLKSNVRIICATNKDLKAEVEKGKFREDLYYRINVFLVSLSPLLLPSELLSKEFPELSFDDFFKRIAVESGYIESKDKWSFEVPKMSHAALDVMKKYAYPGNYRELKNILKYAFVKCNGKVIKKSDLPNYIHEPVSKEGGDLFSLSADKFIPAVNKLIFEVFSRELDKEKGNVSAAARAFKIVNTRFGRLLSSAKDGKVI